MKHKTLNCLEAKQLCDEDFSCAAILKAIPLLCGPELVACSTVTVARCQAALRTLASFSFFQPTCLCKEPTLDPVCNAFRDLLLDHPCIYVNRKEIDMHPLEKIPTCEKATDICTNNSWCRQRLDEFTATCTVANNKCSNPDRESCVRAWLRVRETPLLGCICPNVSDQECVALHELVNSNPCVGPSTFMFHAAAMTKAGVTLGSSLVRPLPLYPHQEPALPPTSMLISCEPTPRPSPSSSDPKNVGVFTPFLQCDLKTFAEHYMQTDPQESLRQIKHVVGTCQTALQQCKSHLGCKRELENVTKKCRMAYCNPMSCRDAVSRMYHFLMSENQILAHHIGLCICRRTGDRSDADCVNAQGFLHPECAERSDARAISHCHRLGRDCRDDKICRYRLEYYEQACAADTLTGRCAGHHQECLKAAMGLFGSPLHINCVCKGDDFDSPSKCLTWKRLMWGNPCVVESQLTYYLSTMGPNFKLDVNFNKPVYGQPRHKGYEQILKDLSAKVNSYANNYNNPGQMNGEVIYHPRTHNTNYNNNNRFHNGMKFNNVDTGKNGINDFTRTGTGPTNVNSHMSGKESVSQARKLESTVRSPIYTTPPHFGREAGGRRPIFRGRPQTSTVTSSTWNDVFFNSFTTTTAATSPLPERYCKVSRDWDDHSPRIIETKDSMRLYKYGNKDCSEICECTENEETYCKVLDCTENIPCETSYAVFNHNAPAYQAFRGECICYSGDFICMRPREGNRFRDDYSLPDGLFLFLGFSHKEEALLKSVTNGGAMDALSPLQKLVRNISKEMGHECQFDLYQNTSDNMILRILPKQFPPISRNSTRRFKFNARRQQEQKDECKPTIDKVANMINTRHHKIHHHARLSLFVLAEVFDNYPNALRSSGATETSISTSRHLLAFITLFPIFCKIHSIEFL